MCARRCSRGRVFEPRAQSPRFHVERRWPRCETPIARTASEPGIVRLGRSWASGEIAPLERTIGRMVIGRRVAWTLTCAAIASAGDPYSRIGITT